MRVAEFGGKRVAIWGLGREGLAAIRLVRQQHPGLPLVLLDDNRDAQVPDGLGGDIEPAFGADEIAGALARVEVVVKSPGVSLYRPEIAEARRRGVPVTSLLNLWFAEPRAAATVCITGTKGKGTTASLITHMLTRLGRKAVLVGNIGVAISQAETTEAEHVIIEMSSYQAADFTGVCDVAVLTALYPEHIDWHQSLDNYYRDKIHLLAQGRSTVINAEAAPMVERFLPNPPLPHLFNDRRAIHSRQNALYDGETRLGDIGNAYLARPHNRSNLCAALTAVTALGIDPAAAVAATADFRGLPHRQQELGERDGILFVDDSISTTPESTLAALHVYAGRAITVILGGYDRGIDYGKLVDRLAEGAAAAVVCLGASGERICEQTRARPGFGGTLYRAAAMADAVAEALRVTPKGGVVLLSPAAPSYGQYRDYIERGRDFAAKAGLPVD
jgi:UDP-N-acetylmuramoylalanine--D-glutamate ligase